MLIFLLMSKLWAIDLDFYKFTNNPVYSITEDALAHHSLVKNYYPWLMTASLSYVKTPLSIKENDLRTGDLVKDMTSFHFGGTYSLKENFQFGFRSYATRLNLLGSNNDGYFIGDTQIEAKYKFLQTTHSAWALHPRLTLPSGTQTFSSQQKVGGYLGLNIEKRFTWFQGVINLGYSHQPGATYTLGPEYSSIDYKNSLFTALGTIFSIKEKWFLNIEAFRHNQLKGNMHPNEVYVGLRHETTPDLISFAGVSGGGSLDQTSNDYRLNVGFKWAPGSYRRPVEELKSDPVDKTYPETYERIILMKREQDLYGKMIEEKNIYFENNSKDLSKEAKKSLDEIALKVKEANGKLVIEGYASARGKHEYNIRLSQKRALNVLKYLNEVGLNPSMSSIVAYGDSKSLDSVAEHLNRKVMIRLYQKEE
jgi:outer membrane protein OmpA-like peptidoglycan-associated protein